MPLALFLHPGLVAAGLAAAAVPILIHLFSRRRVRRVRWAAMAWLDAALKRHQKRLRIENWLVLLLRVAALAVLGTALARLVLTDSGVVALLRPKRSVVLLLDTSYSTGAKDGGRSVADRVSAEAHGILSGLSSEDTVAVVVSNDVRPDRTGLSPAVLVPRGVGREGASRAKEALGSLKATEAPAPWPEALALCASKAVMPLDDVNRTLYWITDLQASDWRRPAPPGASAGGGAPGAPLAPAPRSPAGTSEDRLAKALETLHRLPCAVRVVDAGARAAARRNLSVAEVTRLDPSDVFERQRVRLRVVAHNHGPAAVRGATLRVLVDDASVHGLVLPDLPAADATTGKPGEAVQEVVLGPENLSKAPGPHAVRVQVAPPDAESGADVLSLDSERRLAVQVRERLRVLAWVEPNRGAKPWAAPDQLLRAVYTGGGNEGDVFDLRLARGSGGEAEFRRLLTDPAEEPDLVVLANVTPRGAETQRELVAYVRGGGALVVFAGDRLDRDAVNAAFHAPAAARLMPLPYLPPEMRSRDVPGSHWRLDLERPSTNALGKSLAEAFRWVQRESGVPPQVWGRMALDATPRGATGSGTPPPEEDLDAVVLRFEGSGAQPGPVAVAETAFGQGHAAWAGFGLDDAWLDQSVFFLPLFLDRTAFELTRRPEAGRNVLVGGAIRATVPRDARALRIAVPGRGTEAPATHEARTEMDRPEASFARTATSGVYRLSYERPERPGGAGAAAARVEEWFAVNPDPAESPLARATNAEVETRAPGGDLKVVESAEEDSGVEQGAREGEVTPFLLLAVVLLLLVEQYLAMRFGRHDRTA
jgi:hypothetical protein